MEIRDKHSLSVLMTVMYVAKWEADPDDAHVKVISGSPFLARMYNELVDEMVRLEPEPDKVRRWADWRSIEQRPHQLARIRTWIIGTHPRASWSRELKREYIESLLSPFTATDATLGELLSL